ncbi:MAG: molybdenum cofactor biosynthesis protein MoaE [Allosphingosinicella sp.]
MGVTARLADTPFAPERELAELIGSLDADGAVVSFVGLARPVSSDGAPVTGLFLDHHPRLTERSLAEIAAAAAERFGVSTVRVVHRCGEVPAGEPIVFAAAAASHRRAAFEAADYLMDRLKTDAMFWKREDAADGARWIEPRPEDHQDRARWKDPCPE